MTNQKTITFDAEYSAHAILDSPQFSKNNKNTKMFTKRVAVARKSTISKANGIFFRAGAHGGRRFGQNHRFWAVFFFVCWKRHHQAGFAKMMQNAMVKSDFRVTATHFVNMFVFLLFFENWGESSIACAEYSASKVIVFLVFAEWWVLFRANPPTHPPTHE